MFRHSRLDARRPAGHGKRYKNSIEGRLSFSRALTRYKNRVQSVLCHSKGAGHVAKSFRTSGPERIFKTELLAIPCVPPFGAVCVFRHSRLGARSAVPGCMRVPPFPVRCVFRHSRLDACSAIPGWMRVPPFPAGCVFRHSRLDACSAIPG